MEKVNWLSIDMSAIASQQVREKFVRYIEALGIQYRPTHVFWSSFKKPSNKLHYKTLVCGDLSRIVKQFLVNDRHTWLGTIRESRPFFIALVRTRADERCADVIDDLMRS